MAYASLDSLAAGWTQVPRRAASYASRCIAILLFDGYSLLGAGMVAEIFHAANELTSSGVAGDNVYDVRFLSADGGNVTSSASIRVWTDGLDARYYGGFDALFVAGGKGASAAANHERLIAWLRRVHGNIGMIKAIAEGRLLLDAACIGGLRASRDFGSLSALAAQADSGDQFEAMKCALALVKRDLGSDVARNVVKRLTPDFGGSLLPLLGDAAAGTSPSDKVRAAARWLQENCQRQVSIADAAEVAAMSERNFLRRFKLEMGMTPSDYLLQVRLDITCTLLTDSELPVDKIARRTGMGNGDRLAKVFRKRMMLSPTEYRLQSRLASGV